MQDISIIAKSSISAVGSSSNEVWTQYNTKNTALSVDLEKGTSGAKGVLKRKEELLIEAIRNENQTYKALDRSVLLAIYTGRQTIKAARWDNDKNIGINIGSSRGATHLFEKYHEEFLKKEKQRLSPLASPTTTLGNISSWVAQDLQKEGITMSHSITCSTALHSIVNACAWINAKMSERFLAGGAEAPLTEFTIAQMQSLGIYSKNNGEWPCIPLGAAQENNTMVLGEGACLFALQKGNDKRALAKIIGVGFATETIKHAVALSVEAECLQKSMRAALQDASLSSVDAIVMHAPGTIKGDEAELRAIKKVFAEKVPFLISTKHHTGHTLGASGGLSLDLAVEMLQRDKSVDFPYKNKTQNQPIKPKTTLINAVGFGGNAVSIIVQKP